MTNAALRFSSGTATRENLRIGLFWVLGHKRGIYSSRVYDFYFLYMVPASMNRMGIFHQPVPKTYPNYVSQTVLVGVAIPALNICLY